MKNSEFYERVEPVLTRIRNSDDALFIGHFSEGDDQYHMKAINMDHGDALIVINELVKYFQLDPRAVAAAIASA